MQVPVIAIDGNETASGRALLCLSALYHCSDRLHGVKLRLIDVADADVRLAAEALHWDVGLALDVRPTQSTGNESPLDGVSLYAGIACGSAGHMRLDEADRRHIPTMVAMQFPDESEVSRNFGLQDDAAFDPKLFAEALVETAGRIVVPLDTWLVSALVAPDWYRETYPEVAAAGADPTWHYFTTGWRNGHDPNAWFATEWYLEQNPDLRQAGDSPLHHFVREGARAGGRPHPDFDIAWYSRHYLGLDFPSHVALRHFLVVGERNGLAPNPALRAQLDELLPALVDADWYRATYPDVTADPVQHYLESGWREGRDPNAWFAARWYLEQNPQAGEADSPLHHFVRVGAFAGRRPHPDFDVAWYSRQYLGLDFPSHVALRHFLVIGERDGLAPNPALRTPVDELLPALVDADWYRAAYPDVAADPVQHYLESGWREGRDPNAWFAARWYLEQNPQAGEADSPLHHFVHVGAFAGRRPHPDFDVAWYSRHQLDLGYPSPMALHHFLTVGLAGGCVPNGGLDRRAVRDRLPRHSAAERTAVLKRLAALQRAAVAGKRWDDGDSELWPVLLAREVPQDRIIVLVLFHGDSEASLAIARLLGQALPIHEFPLFARIDGSNRLTVFDDLDAPQVGLILDLPDQIAGLRHLAQALPVGRAVVTDEKLRHGDHVRWLRDAGIPVFINGPRHDPDD